MKPTFSPESTERLKQAYELLEQVYRDEIHSEPGLHMTWLSDASSKVHFVMQSTSQHPVPVPTSKVIVIEAVGR